jgi:cold shock CspA family protein
MVTQALHEADDVFTRFSEVERTNLTLQEQQ